MLVRLFFCENVLIKQFKSLRFLKPSAKLVISSVDKFVPTDHLQRIDDCT